MAVKSLIKSGGKAALAAGIAAMVLPAVASAQAPWRNRGGEAQAEAQPQAQQERREARVERREARQEQRAARVEQQSNAGNVQGRGNGAERGNGGNWQGRGDGGWRRGDWTPGRPQGDQQTRQGRYTPPTAVVPQPTQRQIDRGDRTWRERRDGQTAQTRQWDGDRSVRRDRNWSEQTRRYDGQRYDGQRYDGRRWGGRDREVERNRRWSWNNDWRRDNRYNWYSYRNTNRNVFRLGRYYSPYSNWSYRRLNVGFFLQPLFYSSSYWIDDPWRYRLPDVYGPYRWVRYYDDALLVDIYSGEVVDVIHNFFW